MGNWVDEEKRQGKSEPRLKPAVSNSSKRTGPAKASDFASRDTRNESSVNRRRIGTLDCSAPLELDSFMRRF
jgi:hypothetical protein